MQWVKYDDMPTDLFKEFIGGGLSEILCVGCGEKCLLTTQQVGNMVIIYDIHTKKWNPIPDSKDLKNKFLMRNFINGIGFVPRLDASPHIAHELNHANSI